MKVTENTQPSPDEERTDIKVFADGPEWDELNGRPWFYVKNPRLLACFSVLDAKFDKGLSQIMAEYPGCVLVY